MLLNNEIMIKQAISSQVQEIEVLYWYLEDALEDGNKDRAQGFLIMLLYIAKYKPSLILEGLKEPFRERLKEIPHEIFGNKIKREYKPIDIKMPIDSRTIPFKVESELKNYLLGHRELLIKALEDDVKIIGSEIEVEQYKCDIVVESKTKFYPIELKICQGTHAVVSQCSKYCYYFYRRLRYNHFRKIQGIVISNGFDQWSINELRRVGHWIYFVKAISNSGIVLEKIS